MPLPVFGAAGAGVAATTGSSINVAYPAGITAGDTLIVHVLDWSTSTGPTTPSGWTLITTSDTAVPGRAAAFWKTADGTESGTVSVTLSSSGSGHYGRMYRFSGAAAAVDNTGQSSGATTTVADQGVTTSGPNRLVVNLVAIHDNLSIGAFTGMSGGTWAESADFTSLTGNDACLQLQTADMVSAGTINGGTATVGTATAPGTNDYSVIGFSLPPGPVPIGQALETDSALSITPVLTPSGLSGSIGLTTETDSAFSITPALSAAADLEIYAALNFGSGFEQIEDRLRAANIRRGRPFNLDRVEAGTASAIFANGDGELDPSNTASSWYGRIHPLTPMRILRRQGGITYERFNGPVERFLPDWTQPTYQEVEVQAADSFEVLANTLIVSDQATFTTNLSGTNNDLVFTAIEAGGQGDDITIEYVVAGLSTPLTTDTNEPLSGSAIATSELGFLIGGAFTGVLSKPRIPVAVTVQGSDILVNVATNGAGAAASTAAEIKTVMEATPAIAALVTIAHAPGSSGAGAVTAMAKTNLAGGKWPEERTGARIARILDLAGWSASLRDIDTGIYNVVPQGFSIKQNVTAISHIQDVADSELGYVFMSGANVFTYHDALHRNDDPRSTTSRATFSNVEGTGFDFHDDIQMSFDKDRIVNEATVTGGLQGAVPQTAEDLYSQTGTGTTPTGAPTVPAAGYGKRAISRNTLLASDADCLIQAQSIVAAFAYPLPRLETMTTSEPGAATADAWVAAVLGLEIGDLITAVIRPPAAQELPTSSYEMFVEEITDTYAETLPLLIGLRLTPASQSVAAPPPPPEEGALLNNIGGAFILDSSTDGKLG